MRLAEHVAAVLERFPKQPPIPALADIMPAAGIESLQKMGTKFIPCANALGLWCLELEARGKGKAADIEKELRANLLRRHDCARNSRRHRPRSGSGHQVQPAVASYSGGHEAGAAPNWNGSSPRATRTAYVRIVEFTAGARTVRFED